MSPRSSTVGPGFEERGHAAGRLVQRDVEGQVLDVGQHLVASARQVVADLGPLVQATSERGRPIEVLRGVLAHRRNLRVDVYSVVGGGVHGPNVAKTVSRS
jgi:hypothetical protein